MFYAPKESIEEKFQYFKDKFPNISNEILYRRLSNSYEGGAFNIWTIAEWEKVFNYTGYGHLLTVFKDWDEYLKYNGDYKKHPDYSESKWHLR